MGFLGLGHSDVGKSLGRRWLGQRRLLSRLNAGFHLSTWVGQRNDWPNDDVTLRKQGWGQNQAVSQSVISVQPEIRGIRFSIQRDTKRVGARRVEADRLGFKQLSVPENSIFSVASLTPRS